MSAIDATAQIDADGTLRLTVQTDLPPGPRRVRLDIQEAAAPGDAIQALLDMPTFKAGEWLKSTTLRREELYADWGR